MNEIEQLRAEIDALSRNVEQLSKNLNEAAEIIRALLGAPPPRVWKKFKNVYQRATRFLRAFQERIEQ